MTTATEPQTEPIPRESDTGPQTVLELADAGVPQRDIAKMLNISQPTVSRWKKVAEAARENQRKAVLIAALWAWFAILATIATAAVAYIAWA